MAATAVGTELLAAWRRKVVGIDRVVPLAGGSTGPYVYLDNGATTPALEPVLQAVQDFLTWYASVHRGAGFKSRLATAAYEETREIVAAFVGAELTDRVVVYGKNATEALNKLAARLDFGPDDVVLCTVIEHHSNLLPWRAHAKVEHVELDAKGELDMADLEAKLQIHQGHVRIVAVTGASNVTGYVPPIHDVAELAHRYGAEIVVDAAQLAPHRAIDMRPLTDPRHLDYLVFSAHKMYAPFGTGVLVGPRSLFMKGSPDVVGGGTVRMVTLDEAVWSDPPEKEEAGSPNAVGAIALAAAIKCLEAVGMDTLASHERHLTAYAISKLSGVPGIHLYGLHGAADSLGVLSFNLAGRHHGFVAAVLGWEAGIGVRNGCFCAAPYLLRLLEVAPCDAERVRDDVVHDVRSSIPGAVRASFGFYNNEADIDALAAALERISRDEIACTYSQDVRSGEFVPDVPPQDFDAYFKLACPGPGPGSGSGPGPGFGPGPGPGSQA